MFFSWLLIGTYYYRNHPEFPGKFLDIVVSLYFLHPPLIGVSFLTTSIHNWLYRSLQILVSFRSRS